MPEDTQLYRDIRQITGDCIRPGDLALTERALSACRLPQGARVLDVGCGCGATVMHLRQGHGLQAVGVDLSWMLLAEARARPDPPALIRGRAETLPFADEGLAAVFGECVLSLMPEPSRALAEWRRVLAPHGRLVVSDLYDRSGLPPAPFPTGGGCRAGAVAQETLMRWMDAAGFDVELFEDHTPMLRSLAARLVWTYGSMAAFYEAAGGCSGPGRRFGYYLMVARK